MDDSEYVSILSDDAPGSIPQEPLALVAESGSLLNTPIVLRSPVDDSPYMEPRYRRQFLVTVASIITIPYSLLSRIYGVW